jgi:hypothetical protein
MIVLFTDFGQPYIGQMRALLAREAPGVPVVELFTDLAAWDVRAAAYLLAAYGAEFPAGSIFLSVVDPGVGSERAALVLEADGRWYVGPDNGLFELVARRAEKLRCWVITWVPERLSSSFHGRDLFAPLAAQLAGSWREPPPEVGTEGPFPQGAGSDWPDDLARVIYIDGFGNAITGLRARHIAPGRGLKVGGRELLQGRTFSDLAPGAAFWYENANGLAEIAINRGRASEVLGLAVGDGIELH